LNVDDFLAPLASQYGKPDCQAAKNIAKQAAAISAD
jgi:hypothetical protein